MHTLPSAQSQTLKRDFPYVWATWLRGLLSGEASCEWAAWFKAHHKHVKRPRKINDEAKLAKSQIEHSTLVARLRDKYREDGYTVFSEQQNKFKVESKNVGILSGQPDLVAIKGPVSLVIDAKTRSFKVQDRAQVLLYMWALSKCNIPLYKGRRYDGLLVGPSGEMHIEPDELTLDFQQRLKTLLRRVCQESPPFTAPSPGECEYCDIGSNDCSDRIDDAPERSEEAEEDVF